MRNCFVTNCDIQCRNMTKRMMFMAPKSLEIFELWRAALPKRREFKRTDRVCQRHFEPADIESTWDHNINGKLVQMERMKAKLKTNAVPSLRLQCARELDPNWPVMQPARGAVANTRVKKQKVRKIPATTTTPEVDKSVPRSCISAERMELDENNVEQLDEERVVEEDAVSMVRHMAGDVETTFSVEKLLDDDDHSNDDDANRLRTGASEEDDDATTAGDNNDTSFECLYDDIYEVMLPDTMYGIHRDPERAFIVFSLFDVAQMRTTKVLRIDADRRTSSVYIDGVMCSRRPHTELSVESVTGMLAQLDAQRLCARAQPAAAAEAPVVQPAASGGGPMCLRVVVEEGCDVCAGCA